MTSKSIENELKELKEQQIVLVREVKELKEKSREWTRIPL